MLSVTGDENLIDTLGKIQPFRYRGYVYDVETGLYYLRSRYYDSTIVRFNGVDKIVEGNLFEYCENNPISRIDPSGCIGISGIIEDIKRYASSDEEELRYARSVGFYGPIIAYKAKKASDLAKYYTNILYENIYGKDNAAGKDGTRANALLHALWNTIMTLEIGYDHAKAIANAHEAPFSSDDTLHYDIPNFEHSEMDYYNNEFGRQYGLLLLNNDIHISYDDIAGILYKYFAESQDAYYRITTSGEIRSIEESRPRDYDRIMHLAK